MSEFQKLRELLAKATKGEWVTFQNGGGRIGVKADSFVVTWNAAERANTDEAQTNAALIAAAVNAMPEILDRLEAAESALQQQGKAVAWQNRFMSFDGYWMGWSQSQSASEAEECVRRLLEAGYPKAEWRALYTHPPKPVVSEQCPACNRAWTEHRMGYSASSCKAKPLKPVVSDERVDVAFKAFHSFVPTNGGTTGFKQQLKAALEAALGVKS